MRTLESVVEELRLIQENMDSLCGFDPGQPTGLIRPSMQWLDSPIRCTLSAVWHLKAGKPPDHMMLQSCDRHLAMCQRLVRDHNLVPSIHEYGSTCGLPGTFWVDDLNACASQEVMFELGLFQTITSKIQDEADPNRCTCRCPACNHWMHLIGECDRAIDTFGYTHTHYAKLTMEERVN